MRTKVLARNVNQKNRMIKRASKTYGDISTCIHKKTFADCFTVVEDKLYFWFNSRDTSTHLITEDIDNGGITC
jgi:hypothetical protein